MDDLERMRQLKQQGFYCSQMLLMMGMELQGKENPDLVAAMHGLAGGIGFAGETCGALTGGGCLLGLYAGKGTPEQDEDPRLRLMADDLVRWFKEEHGLKYGGIRCEDILTIGGKEMGSPCPAIIASTYQKVKELLVENGFDLAGPEW
jgi:C_GCAxxG_C_C family probable redox protein